MGRVNNLSEDNAMRVAFLLCFFVAICIVQAGCATFRYGKVLISAVQGSRAEAIRLPKDPDHPPSGAATLAYWKSLKESGWEHVAQQDAPIQIAERLARYAENLRALPVLDVDPELVEKVLVMAREWKNISDLAVFLHKECWPMIAPAPGELQEEFEKTGALAVQAHEAVKAMRPVLTQRYNIEFPAK